MQRPMHRLFQGLLHGGARRLLKATRLQHLSPAFKSGYARIMREAVGPAQWCIDRMHLTDTDVELQGWALAPGMKHTDVGFALNGGPFDRVLYPLDRADMQSIFWYLPEASKSGFICRGRLATAQAEAAGHLEFQLIDKRTGQPLKRGIEHYFPSMCGHILALPGPRRRQRVHGDMNADSFRRVGYTVYVQLEQTLRRCFDHSYGDCGRILDWGCGCGRVLRYFHELPAGSVTGVDIDADNIEYCQRKLPFAQFATIPLQPPTALPAHTFDLIIGVSVFTHLREKEQRAWLGELHRLAAPGAALLMTVHGATVLSRARWPARAYQEWQSAGFAIDESRNYDLAGVVEDMDYYCNSFHTPDYIRRTWSPYFEIVEILPGYVEGLQDLVVLRKR